MQREASQKGTPSGRTETGIETRHSRGCPANSGGKCSGKPRCVKSYRAEVYSNREQRKIRRTFPGQAAAKQWRIDASSTEGKQKLRAPSKTTTVRVAGEALIDGMRSGAVRNRSGNVYKPSVTRGYKRSLENRIYPVFGREKLTDVMRADVQAFADALLAETMDASTLKNTLMPLRVIYRRALARDEVAVNPTTGLELPAVVMKPSRFATVEEADALIGALAEDDQAVYASAFFAGLRAGELAGLASESVEQGRLRVVQAWDSKERLMGEPKSAKGKRWVPIPKELRSYLVRHKLRTGRSGGLLFGQTAETPFNYWSLVTRAHKAWRAAGLEPIGLHECRHTYASLMIAAGVNAKALSTFMGHASIQITLDRYGHLMPGNEDEASALLDGYLESSRARTTSAAV